jgi:hypothetical protein
MKKLSVFGLIVASLMVSVSVQALPTGATDSASAAITVNATGHNVSTNALSSINIGLTSIDGPFGAQGVVQTVAGWSNTGLGIAGGNLTNTANLTTAASNAFLFVPTGATVTGAAAQHVTAAVLSGSNAVSSGSQLSLSGVAPGVTASGAGTGLDSSSLTGLFNSLAANSTINGTLTVH